MKTQIIRHRVTGETLFEGSFETIRHAVEEAVAGDICLDHADLSGTNLINAALDGARLRRARFENANLAGANLSESVLDGADFTGASLLGANLCLSSLRGCIFDGVQFGATDIGDCDIGGSLFSTPSAFLLNFTDTVNMKDCYYSPSSHEACMMSRPPVVVHGLPQGPIAFMDDHVMIGGLLFPREYLFLNTNDNLPACHPKNLDINLNWLYK